MKTRIALLASALCAAAATVHATLIACDGFEDASVGGLDGQDSGTGFSGAYSANSGATVVGAATTGRGKLAYQNGDIKLDGGALHLVLSKGSADRVLTREFPQQAGQYLYMSFLVRTPVGTIGENDFDNAYLGMADAAETGDNRLESRAGYMAGNVRQGNDYIHGLRANGENYASEILIVPDTAEFVVVRARKNSDAENHMYKHVDLYVNPSTLDEPAEPDFHAQRDNVSSLSHLVATLYRSRSEDTDLYDVDAIRIGTTWADVVGPLPGSSELPRPTITPAGGAFAGSVEVAISSVYEGDCELRYTLDGTTPSASNGIVYTEPFTLTESATVQAIALPTTGSENESPVMTATFTVTASEIHWIGEGEDDDWMTPENWRPNGSPIGASIVFGAEDRTSNGTVNNTIPYDMAVASLCYTNSSTYPAPTVGNNRWHVTEIPVGVTLTITGADSRGNALSLLGPVDYEFTRGEFETSVNMSGHGTLRVDSPSADVVIAAPTTDYRGTARLDMRPLTEFDCTAANVWIGRGGRCDGEIFCARENAGTNTITAANLFVGDGDDFRQGDGDDNPSRLWLAKKNVLNVDRILIAGSDKRNTQCGKIDFQTGISGDDPLLVVRGRDGGESRADLVVGSHGNGAFATDTAQGILDLTGGRADALLGDVLVGDGGGRGGERQGKADGIVRLADGVLDMESLVLGRSTLHTGDAATDCASAFGTIEMTGGRLVVSGDTVIATNGVGAMQSVVGTLSQSAGDIEIGGRVVMGTRAGAALRMLADLELRGGTFTAFGGIVSGPIVRADESDGPAVTNLIHLAGGTLCVTNADGTAELSLLPGTLSLESGEGVADSVSLDHDDSVLEAILSADGCATISVKGDISVGGTLRAVLAEGYTPRDGLVWPLLAGSRGSVRTGTFDVRDLPENVRVLYTSNGVSVFTPAAATMILLR